MWNEKNRLKYKYNGADYKHRKEYIAWRDMRQRCNNPKNKGYKNYGGRGISICERWDNFYNFLEDMGRSPAYYSLDRINNDGNYCKDNCRWADRRTQQRNTRRNKRFFAFGMKKTVAEWSEYFKIPLSILSYRIYSSNYDIEIALTKPIHKRPSRTLVNSLPFQGKKDGSIPS